MKKTLLSFAAIAAMLFVPQVVSAQASDASAASEVVTYDFTKLTVIKQPANLNGSAANGQAFYAWEKADKTDSKRQDYKGYTWEEGLDLPDPCHVWRRNDRINGNIVPEGLKCPADREMVIDGLQEGSVVKIYYDASATVTQNAETGESSEPAQILWVAAMKSEGEGEGATLVPTIEATIGEVAAVTGETKIPSGEAITITKFNLDENHVGGYIAFKVIKNMIISKIEVTTGETTDTYDFTKLTVIKQPANLNGSAANGQAFYAWEKADKTDSKRQDYKGYTWEEGLELPDPCHVWRRSDRINGNIVAKGLKCPADREMVIDGLQEGAVVKIYYDASAAVTTNAETGESETAQILWVAAMKSEGEGDGATLVPTIEATVDGAAAVTGETKIPSGVAITVTKFNVDENHVGGYIAFRVIKNMIISKIEIEQGSASGIQSIATSKQENGAAWYDLQGRRVATPSKGLYINSGKKVLVP